MKIIIIIIIIKSSTNKTVKRFRKSNQQDVSCDVPAYEAYKAHRNYSSNNTSKQGAQTRGIFELSQVLCQHNDRLAKNTKKNSQLGTAHHNDAIFHLAI